MLWLFVFIFCLSSTEKHFLSWLFFALHMLCFSSSLERILSWHLFTLYVSFFLLFRALSVVALLRSGFSWFLSEFIQVNEHEMKVNDQKRAVGKKFDVLLAYIWQVGRLNWLILFLFFYRFDAYLCYFINEDNELRRKLWGICPTGLIQPIKQGFLPNRFCEEIMIAKVQKRQSEYLKEYLKVQEHVFSLK